jgi:hypothetical protein
MANLKDYQVDEALTRISVDYQTGNMIADIVMPRIEVQSRVGYYFTFDKARKRIHDANRTGLSRANRINNGMSKTAFGPLKEQSLEADIEYEVRDTFPTPHDARVEATDDVSEALDLIHEKDVADLLTNASATNISQTVTLSGTDQWNDYANSDPFDDIQTGIDTVKLAAGVTPNKLILGYQVWSKLRHHPDLLGRLSVASVRVLTRQLLADLLEIEEVLIADGTYNTADEGQTASMGYVWGKHAILVYVTNNPGIRKMNLGYTLQVADARYVDRWDEPAVKAEFVRANDYYEEKLVAAEAGYLIKSAVA